jgi:hypothetical protein
MMFVPASAASVIAFVAIVAAVVGAFVAGVRHAYRSEPHRASTVTRNVSIGLALWLGFLSWLVGSGRIQNLPLSGLPFFFGSIAAVSLAVGLSPLGRHLAANVSLAALVGFQAFRLPLELVLHSWAAQGTIPTTMTWTGRNWDIVSGIVALIACPFAAKSRAVAWVANLIGLVLLLNVMRVALMSSPVPFGWHVEPPLLLAFHLPYALIGPVCVSGALIGHIVLTRALLQPIPKR